MVRLPPGQFGVILADPPWAYEMYSDKGYGKSPDVHYNCMPFAELVALRDQLLFVTAPNSVCFMWAVWPKLDEALELMKAWGFQYKTGGAWHKRSASWTPGTPDPKSAFGTGYLFRSASEPFLVGTIGNPDILNRSTRNIIEAAVREHSRKPEEQYTMIERLFRGPYLELFARSGRPGWTSWGNETEKFTRSER